MNHFSLGQPDYVTIETEEGRCTGVPANGKFMVKNVCVRIDNDHVELTAGNTPVKYVLLRWNTPAPERVRVLGDTWERAYGDLEWRCIDPTRVLPWYFIAADGNAIRGYGVRVRPDSMCYWMLDEQGISLLLDVRCGGDGVILNGNTLRAADIICAEEEGDDTFHAARDFCGMMCADPLTISEPVFGGNNWYYAYGKSSESDILRDTDEILDLSAEAYYKPYMIIDDGWQKMRSPEEKYKGGPWDMGNTNFPDMPGLAHKMIDKGVKPGIWVRLLLDNSADIPDDWHIMGTSDKLDPSVPAVLDHVYADIDRFCSWGFQCIKHDYSFRDIFNKWGFELRTYVTREGWHFADRSKTSAQIIKKLYETILSACRTTGAIVLGCNTIGHLGAGLMHLHRTGDDTSGVDWERTRRYGVNALAFRLPQHEKFFAADADCVGIMGPIPWELNRQWADVIAESGTPLFISAKPGLLTGKQRQEMREIIRKASSGICHKIPADWMDTVTPRIWKDEKEGIRYNWCEETGPFPKNN